MAKNNASAANNKRLIHLNEEARESFVLFFVTNFVSMFCPSFVLNEIFSATGIHTVVMSCAQ